jgi:hypothetical protein
MRIHSIFHISLLEQAHPEQLIDEEAIANESEYEIEEILAKRIIERITQYRVR